MRKFFLIMPDGRIAEFQFDATGVAQLTEIMPDGKVGQQKTVTVDEARAIWSHLKKVDKGKEVKYT